jgi:PTH1 family peptidyl-tRNA hydrolase
MGLIQKKPLVGTSIPLYTIGSSRTVVMIGLGNPETKYAGTRHNIGFRILDDFAKNNDFSNWVDKKDLKCFLATASLGQNRVILCKPTTYMNNSGEAANAVQHFFKVPNKQTLAIYDELAIPFGQIRTRSGGSDAGHNGVKSLIQYIGDDFGRLRIGIGSDLTDKKVAGDFVLGKFSKKERESLPTLIREANSLITEIIFNGIQPETRTVFQV